MSLSKFTNGRGCYEQAYKIQEDLVNFGVKTWGERDFKTLTAMCNHAGYLYQQMRFLESYQLYVEAIPSLALQYKLEHPSVLIAINGMANAMYGLGFFTEAIKLLEDAAIASERSADNISIMLSIKTNLANMLYQHDQQERALVVKEECLTECRQFFGEKHPNTLAVMNNLANIRRKLGDLHGARKMQETALTGRAQLLGCDHSDTWASMVNLGNILCDMGDFKTAVDLYAEAHSYSEKSLGSTHSDTKQIADSLSIARAALAKDSPPTLTPGQSSPLLAVDPAAHFHPTGLEITPGAHYRFVASGQWRDGFLKPVGPEGRHLPWAERFNRLPGQPFFLLCGCVGRDLAQAFAIGAGLADWQAPAALAEQADRQLYLFANDWAGMYWNNHALPPAQGGPLCVQVTRLA